MSVNGRGTSGGNAPSNSPRISDDGRVIAFKSFATDLAANDRTENADIYARDMMRDVTTLVSVNMAGTNGGTDGRGQGLNSSNHIISPNGRFIAFSGVATDLAPNKTSLLTTDVFVRDLETGTTTLASVNREGRDSNSTAQNLFVSIAADFSGDGRLLVFRSSAPDLVANDSNNADDIFVRNLTAGTTVLASRNRSATASGNGVSLTADISGDGRLVVFDSLASDVTTNDNNNAPDVFALQLATTPAPRITRLRYKSSGKLIVTGENFDDSARLFVDAREVTARRTSSQRLQAKKLGLTRGSHEVRVVNKDGQVGSSLLTVD